MEQWVGKVVLITGTTAGLGNYLAKQLVDLGIIVAGIARSTDRLKAMEEELIGRKGRFVGFTMDLLDEDGLIEGFENIEKTLGPVAVLVNNASAIADERLLDCEHKSWENSILINVLGPTVLMKLAVASMKKSGIKGHIINIGGTASYYTSVFQDYHFYSVTKFMLRAVGDALRSEFRANNIPIRVCHIGPGHIKTGGQDRLSFSSDALVTGFAYFASEYYNMKYHKLPRKFPFNCDGDNLYNNDVLPALTMDDVSSVIIGILSNRDEAEVMDVIMKPTDRKNSVFESDFYWKS